MCACGGTCMCICVWEYMYMCLCVYMCAFMHMCISMCVSGWHKQGKLHPNPCHCNKVHPKHILDHALFGILQMDTTLAYLER